MPKTSNAAELGTPLPTGTLMASDGRRHELADLAGDGPVLVAFLANHCPYVQHVERALGTLAKEASGDGLTVIGVASNDVAVSPGDDVGGMEEQIERAGWGFPYLRDLDQSVARAFGAMCTPEFFLFDRDHRLVYRGAFDASSPGNHVEVTGDELRAAVRAVLAGEAPAPDQRLAMGCSIKWSPGNEPD